MNKFFRNVVGFALKNKVFVFFITVVAIIAGAFSYINTPIEAFPDVMSTRVIIITQWSGRSAEEVEKFVTIPIEIEMNSVPKKTSLRSISLFGLSVITIMFEDDMEDFRARQEVANRLQGINLPDGADPEIEPPYGPTGEIFRYTLKSKTRSVRELKTIQDWVIERQIKAVPGIADVVSFGGQVKTYEVSVDPGQLAKYNMTALDVYTAISKSNVNVGGDVITKNNQAYVVRGIGLLNDIHEIENVIIDSRNNTPILVKNVARVVESSLPKLGFIGRDSTDDLVEGIIVMRKGENPSEVLAALRDKVSELNDVILPADVKIDTFYDRGTLINYTTHTVLHNLLEGIFLVTVIVFVFMLDWRTTVIVSIIIPLALLFAFFCMKMKGMTANLLSLGAVDFGIIIDGAVVMVEGLFVALDELAHKYGPERFNKLSKLGMIKRIGGEKAKAVFFSKMIIITALLPIFSFQKVEGKMFSPLAWTLGFALLGALIFTLTLVPVLISILLNTNVKEKHNVFVEFIQKKIFAGFSFTFKNGKTSLAVATAIMIFGLVSFNFLGTEFLPHLNEGAIYIRANMPLSTSLDQSVEMTKKLRKIMVSYPEIRGVMSQTGRPNDGTDPTSFFNIEFHVDLKPKEEWTRNITKDQLIDSMQARFAEFQGISFNFSQPIMDNVEEAVSGVKGSLAVKIYGTDLFQLEELADSAQHILEHVQGVEDLGVVKLIGQPELRVELNQEKMGVYGVATADAQAVIEMAIGGKGATQIYEGERKFDIRVRYSPEYREDESAIGMLMVPTLTGTKVPLKEIARIHTVTGPAFVYREGNKRFCAVKFSVRGRDLGSTIAEAQKKVGEKIKLGKGMSMEWKGEFENQVRAQKRLGQVVPISLTVIFILLFITFGSFQDAGLVILKVPFALIGGIWMLLLTSTNFSISAGVGFIALFGVCVQNGVLLISGFHEYMQMGYSLVDSIESTVRTRIRPVVMTAMMAAIGLLPAAISTGIGSETQRPLARVMIGGLVTDTIFTLLIFPIILELVYARKLHKEQQGHQARLNAKSAQQ
ncbi:MAG: efflux RND transporter permease subunit [Bacteroidetes bacterium]|nr:efflux RND transporter permease subunit [Bacteroidota bacterium]